MKTNSQIKAMGLQRLAIMLSFVFSVLFIKGQSNRTYLQKISSDNNKTIEQKDQLKAEWIKDHPNEYAKLTGNNNLVVPEFKTQTEKQNWYNANTEFIITPPAVGANNIKSKELTIREEKMKNWQATQEFIAKHKNKLDPNFELVYYSDFESVSKDKKDYILMNPSLFLVLPADITKPIN